MSVKPETLAFHWAGSTGSIDRDGPVEYTALWRVQVDDPFDQVQTVIVWWQLNQFILGTPYTYANDAFGSLATAQNISATRMLETTDWWIVSVKYSRESFDAKKDKDDNDTTDPLEYRPIIRCSSNAVSGPAELLKYEGGYSPRVTGILEARQTAALDGKISPCNSAETTYDPLPVRNSFHWYISVEGNLAAFDGNNSNIGFTNSLSLRFDYQGFTRGPVAPDQCLIRDCEIELKRQNSINYWMVRYYIEVKPDGEDFLYHIIDRGMEATAIDGHPDGHGGVFGPGAQNTPPPIDADRVGKMVLVDAHEVPIREPVLFDGDGKAVPAGDTAAPVVALWSEDKRVDFETLPVITEILGPLLPP